MKGYVIEAGYMGYVKKIIRNILESGIEIKLPQ